MEGGWYAYHPVGGAITVLAAKGGQGQQPVQRAPAAGSLSGTPAKAARPAKQHKGSLFDFSLPGSKSSGQGLGSAAEEGGAAGAAAVSTAKPLGRRPVIEVIDGGSSSSGGAGVKTAPAAAGSRDTSLLKP